MKRRDEGAADGLRWRKSRISSAEGNCVELAELPGNDIAVRNSRFPDGPVLQYTQAEMSAFITGVKAGEFDDLTHADCPLCQ